MRSMHIVEVHSANILGIRYSAHKVICGLVFFGSWHVPRSAMVGAEQAVVVRVQRKKSPTLSVIARWITLLDLSPPCTLSAVYREHFCVVVELKVGIASQPTSQLVSQLASQPVHQAVNSKKTILTYAPYVVHTPVL